jgi:hypothetical protein
MAVVTREQVIVLLRVLQNLPFYRSYLAEPVSAQLPSPAGDASIDILIFLNPLVMNA